MFKALVSLIGAVAVGAVAYSVVNDESITVTRIIDGDTIEVSADGGEKRVRLLNINTPELAHDGNQADCLATEAKQFLEGRLPKGTKVDLEYDIETTDKYGRDLAGVFVDGTFINEEIVAAGFAVAIKVEPNTKFYSQLKSAEQRSRESRIGVFGVGEQCMVTDDATAQFEDTVAEDIAQLSLSAVDSNEDADVKRAEIKRLRGQVNAFRSASSQRSEFETQAYDDPREAIARRADTRLNFAEATLEKAVQQFEMQRLEAQRLEAQRVEAQRLLAERQSQQQETVQPAPAAGAGSLADNYTGCRAYGGNYALTSIDKQGRRYAKIDCTTKAQIG